MQLDTRQYQTSNSTLLIPSQRIEGARELCFSSPYALLFRYPRYQAILCHKTGQASSAVVNAGIAMAKLFVRKK